MALPVELSKIDILGSVSLSLCYLTLSPDRSEDYLMPYPCLTCITLDVIVCSLCLCI